MTHSHLPKARFLDRTTPPHIATLVVMASLSAVSMNIFLPSLPAMARTFDTSYATMQLAISLYLGVSGALQIVIGPLADRYGRRPVVLVSLVLFLIASLGALVAPTVEIFLIFRMLQASIAACMVLSRAIVRDMVPENEAAAMIGWVTMGMSLMPMVMPALGGVLEQAFGWQSNFVLLLVAGAAVLLLCWTDQGETAQRGHSSLLTQIRAWPTLLRSPRFWGYAVAAAANSGAFFAYLGGIPAVGTGAWGLSPSQLGIYFVFAGIGYMIGNYLSARTATRIGVPRMVFIGTSILMGATALMLVLDLMSLSHPMAFFPLMALVGLGNGVALPSANSGMMSVRPDLIGSASGLGGAMAIGGGAILSAVAASLTGAGETARPLILIMLACSTAGVVAILLVMRRNRRLGL